VISTLRRQRQGIGKSRLTDAFQGALSAELAEIRAFFAKWRALGKHEQATKKKLPGKKR
jgi:hypothetical protein